MAGGGSYDWTYVVPLAEVLRSHGVPFGYVADARLEPAELAGYRVLVLPSVACLSTAQRGAIRSFVRGGAAPWSSGTWTSASARRSDGRGHPGAGTVWDRRRGADGVRRGGPPGCRRPAPRDRPHAPLAVRAGAARAAGRAHPARTMPSSRASARATTRRCADHCLAVGRVRAGTPSWPPSLTPTGTTRPPRHPGGRAGWRTAPCTSPDCPRRRTRCRSGRTRSSTGPRVVRSATEWAARARPALLLDGFPPVTDYQRARPEDVRAIPTVEFFPLVGERLAVACFASYAYERYDFRLVVRTPAGQTVHTARGLLTEEDVPYTPCADGAVLGVQLTPAARRRCSGSSGLERTAVRRGRSCGAGARGTTRAPARHSCQVRPARDDFDVREEPDRGDPHGGPAGGRVPHQGVLRQGHLLRAPPPERNPRLRRRDRRPGRPHPVPLPAPDDVSHSFTGGYASRARILLQRSTDGTAPGRVRTMWWSTTRRRPLTSGGRSSPGPTSPASRRDGIDLGGPDDAAVYFGRTATGPVGADGERALEAFALRSPDRGARGRRCRRACSTHHQAGRRPPRRTPSSAARTARCSAR